MTSATFSVTVAPQHRNATVDVTNDLARAVEDSGVVDGCVIAYCLHTTCGLLINEWERGALEDLRDRLDALVPDDFDYAHDHLARRRGVADDERRNGRAHVAQMILGGTSQAIPVSGGAPVLGTWQRLMLLELDGGSERTVVFQVFGE
jgi:secondary thiamine-phosphate synthase enzyme